MWWTWRKNSTKSMFPCFNVAISCSEAAFLSASAVVGIEKSFSIFSVHIELVGFAFDIEKWYWEYWIPNTALLFWLSPRPPTFFFSCGWRPAASDCCSVASGLETRGGTASKAKKQKATWGNTRSPSPSSPSWSPDVWWNSRWVGRWGASCVRYS